MCFVGLEDQVSAVTKWGNSLLIFRSSWNNQDSSHSAEILFTVVRTMNITKIPFTPPLIHQYTFQIWKVLLVGIDVHVLGWNFFPKHGLDTEDIVFPFFDCWDFPAVSALERVKEGFQIAWLFMKGNQRVLKSLLICEICILTHPK